MKPLILLFMLFITLVARGHEMRPCYLDIKEVEPETYEVLWKVPALGDKRLSMEVLFDEETKTSLPPTDQFVAAAHVRRWKVSRPGGLDGSNIRIEGLSRTFTDVLVHVTHLDGNRASFRITPDNPRFTLETKPSWHQTALTYAYLGFEHILAGIDHLLFVLALMILVKGQKKLLGTITAFTVAHSLTLGAATLGWIEVPGPPVEACIALSIVLIAVEIVHSHQGRKGLTERLPWLVAFTFGLLHGLGFAGALGEVGLPQAAIPLALLFFNIGVELGQLAFVAVVLSLAFGLRRVPWTIPTWSWRIAPYAIGSIAAFWVIERSSSFISIP
jgi:hydrogenase/urease accessory protein HupE